MRFLDEHALLRILLLLVGTLFAVFINDLLTVETPAINVLLYCSGVSFLFFVALFYKFPPPISLRKMRQDLTVALPRVLSEEDSKIAHELNEKNSLLKTLLKESREAFWSFNVVTEKVIWTSRVAEILNCREEDLGDNFDFLSKTIFEHDFAKFKKGLSVALETHQEFAVEVKAIHGRDSYTISGRPEINQNGRPVRVIGRMALHVDFAKVIHVPDWDSLTGLKNREGLLNELERENALFEKDPNYVFALVLIDIDHFGNINNTYSAKFGDNILKVIGKRLASFCGNEVCTARIAGDLFGILLSNIHDENETLLKFVRELHTKMRAPMQLESKEILLGTTMSVILNRDADSAIDMLESATTLLRGLKANDCRGSIHFFNGEIKEKAMHLYTLERDLRKAIQENHFTLVFQPVIDTRNKNRVVSFEALVRWNNSSRRMIPPSEFIPLAERSGLIIPLGDQILRSACKQMKQWIDYGYSDIRMAVNFSAQQFAQDNLVENLRQIFRETNMNPKNLKVEITEYTAMNDSDKVLDMMRELTSMGIEISIDDFGTGFSALSYLKRFPVHTLKIDKSFIDSVSETKEDAAFVRMIIGIARSLNMELIAEGVETKEQLGFLQQEGCNLIQGYYFSRPLPPDEAFLFLQKQNNG